MNMSKLATSRMVVSLSRVDCALAGLPIQNRAAKLKQREQVLVMRTSRSSHDVQVPPEWESVLRNVHDPCQLRQRSSADRRFKQLGAPTGSCSRENRHGERKFVVRDRLEENLSSWNHTTCTLDASCRRGGKLDRRQAGTMVVVTEDASRAPHIGRWWRVALRLRETSWGQAPEG